MRAPFRVAVITGASSGLGASLTKSYAAKEVRVRLLGRDRRRLAETAHACEAKGAAANVAAIDVADAKVMARWLCEFDREHPIDLLIANAGTSAGPDPDYLSEGVDLVARQVGVNLLGAINTIEPLLSAFCSRRRGELRSCPRSLPIGGSPTARAIAQARPGCVPMPRRYGRAWNPTASA